MRNRSCRQSHRCGPLAAAAVLLAAGAAASGKTYFVNAGATGAGTGNTWADAYIGLQPALARAGTGDQIWIAQGTYRPAGPGGDRAASFFLRNGVAIYGGFVGTEIELAQRDWVAHTTILSGDLNADDGPEFANTGDNSYHVTVALNVNETAILDGLTIRGGYANGPGYGAVPESQDQGSGLNVYFSTPHVENCAFERNWSANHGAINDHGSSTIINCTFRENHSRQFGAGLYIHHESNTTATGCTFIGNVAEAEGGAFYCRSMTGATLSDSTFTGNRAVLGAGCYNAEEATTFISNCSFWENTAEVGGGGIYNSFSSPTILGCIFTDNIAGVAIVSGGSGGGGSGGGGIWSSGGAAVVADCRFTNNSASFGGGVYLNEGSAASVLGSVFEGNIASEAGGCYILASPATVAGCSFRDNTATGGQFPVGGGVSCYFADATVRDCTFTNNHSELGGGGLYTEGAAAIIQKCRFFANDALDPQEGWGGGILVGYNAAVSIRNCLFVGNRANRGGGIFNLIFCSSAITNCTIVANTAGVGGGIQTFTGTGTTGAGNIIWSNTPTELDGEPFPLSFSCVLGGAPGNIASDPRFVRMPGPGPDGVWGTGDDDYGDLHIQAGSGCIDSGDTSVVPAGLVADLEGAPRRHNDPGTPDSGVGPAPVVDMGVYEFQGTSCYPNCDGSTGSPRLTAADFGCYINRFVAGEPWANCDGSSRSPVLNAIDFACFLNKYAAGCS